MKVYVPSGRSPLRKSAGVAVRERLGVDHALQRSSKATPPGPDTPVQVYSTVSMQIVGSIVKGVSTNVYELLEYWSVKVC